MAMPISMHKLALALMAATAESLAESQQLPRRRIVVSIPDCKLAVVEEGRVVKVFATAVGALKTPTPAGSFVVVQRIPHPTWYGPRAAWWLPGKANPLGTRWIGLSRKGYGIHGTNNPALHRTGRFARLRAAAQCRCGRVVRVSRGRRRRGVVRAAHTPEVQAIFRPGPRPTRV